MILLDHFDIPNIKLPTEVVMFQNLFPKILPVVFECDINVMICMYLSISINVLFVKYTLELFLIDLEHFDVPELKQGVFCFKICVIDPTGSL